MEWHVISWLSTPCQQWHAMWLADWPLPVSGGMPCDWLIGHSLSAVKWHVITHSLTTWTCDAMWPVIMCPEWCATTCNNVCEWCDVTLIMCVNDAMWPVIMCMNDAMWPVIMCLNDAMWSVIMCLNDATWSVIMCLNDATLAVPCSTLQLELVN